MGGTSRVTGDCQARFREGLGVKFPGPTRPRGATPRAYSADSSPGFRAELENLVCDGKGKGTSGRTARPKVPRRRPGADCSVVVVKRGNSRGAKGAGDLRGDRSGSTGNRRNRLVSTEGGSFQGWQEPCELSGSSTVP